MLELSAFNLQYSKNTKEEKELEKIRRSIIQDVTAKYAAIKQITYGLVANRWNYASEQSIELYETLVNLDVSIDAKWEAIHAYVNQEKNLGKTLYNIIQSELKEHIVSRSSLATSLHIIGDSMKESLSTRVAGDSTLGNAAGILAKSFTGFAAGLFTVTTRNNFHSAEEINASLDILKKFESGNEVTSAHFINEVLARYSTAKIVNLSTSSETTALIAKLKDENVTAANKVKAIREYMDAEDKGYYKNNGKKLFNVVFEITQRELAAINHLARY